jgi:hypothetical protein
MASAVDLPTFVKAALKTSTDVLSKLTRGPKVERVRFVVGPDSTGETAIFVWVVLSDRTPEAELRHVNFQGFADEVRETIRVALRGYGITLFPFVRFLLGTEERDFVPSVAEIVA